MVNIYANLFGKKKIFDIRKEFNYHRTGLEHKHCRSFIVLEHHYGRRDVMWKRSILSVFNLVLDIHVIVNWQLSKRYPLTSVTRLYRGFRYITHGDDIVFKLSANQQRARPIFERWNSVCFLLKAKNKFLEKDISQNIPREIRFFNLSITEKYVCVLCEGAWTSFFGGELLLEPGVCPYPSRSLFISHRITQKNRSKTTHDTWS